MSAPLIQQDEWVLGWQAQKILGLTYAAWYEFKKRHELTRQELPGCRVRYYRPELERIARDSIKPGKV